MTCSVSDRWSITGAAEALIHLLPELANLKTPFTTYVLQSRALSGRQQRNRQEQTCFRHRSIRIASGSRTGEEISKAGGFLDTGERSWMCYCASKFVGPWRFALNLCPRGPAGLRVNAGNAVSRESPVSPIFSCCSRPDPPLIDQCRKHRPRSAVDARTKTRSDWEQPACDFHAQGIPR
jgi:hypothetical protein